MKYLGVRSMGLLLGITLMCALPAIAAQAGSEVATVAGSVASRDGARLPLATIRLVREDTGAVFRCATGEQGAFRLAGLPPGTYALTAVAPGFAARVIGGLRVEAGVTTVLDVELDVARIEEVVTVEGVAPRDSLEAAAIRETPARDVAEALSTMAGLSVVRKGGIAGDVVLRGLQGRDVNVLVDGQRVHGACPARMDPAIFHVEFAEVDRVEVAKGPFDVKNQGSLGGVINVVTRGPEPGWHAAPSASAGSFGFINPAATASYGGRTFAALGGFSHRRSLAYADGTGRRFTERANYRPDAVDGGAYRIWTAWTRALWTPGAGNRLQLSYARQHARDVLSPYLLMDAITDDVDRVNVKYQATGRAVGLTGLEVQGYFTRVDHWMTDAHRLSSIGASRPYSMGTQAETRTFGGRLEASVRKTTLGVEAIRRRWDATTEMAAVRLTIQRSIPNVVVDSVGAFVEDVRDLGPRVSLVAGGRVDWFSSAADASVADVALYEAYKDTRALSRVDLVPSGKVRLVWKPSRAIEIGGGVGHTVRVAEANERFIALRRMGADWVGNPDLRPSRHTAVDVSASVRQSRWSATADVYAGRIKDAITVHTQSRMRMTAGVMNARARSYANVDVNLLGGEFEATAIVTSRLFLTGDLAVVHGSKDRAPALGIRSTRLAETPPARASLRLRFDDGRVFAAIEGVLVRTQKRVDADLGETPTPGHEVVNVHAGVRHGRLSANVGIANLFDRAYTAHLSYQRDPFRAGARLYEPGRNLFTNVAWRF